MLFGTAKKRILINSLLIGALTSLASIYFKDWTITLAVALSALAMSANFWLLCKVIEGVFRGDTSIPRWKIVARLLAKVIFIFGALAIFIYVGKLEPLAMLAGISNVVVAIFIEGLLPAPRDEEQGQG
ncbi:MAG: hypothetical protein GXP49_04690 [Deltaproteobacteria bacterium]|nr:hypothetical protein [Deltaproteobacteria bacterium]